MRTGLFLTIAMALVLAPAWAQRPGEQEHAAQPQRGEMQHEPEHNAEHNAPRANEGHIPQPPAHRQPTAKPEAERKQGRVNDMPHVNNGHWYGHDRPNDNRYHVERPFEHGHFEHFGPSYRYNVIRVDRDLHRVWLPGGYWFEIASWDWPLAADWCWTCDGDDFVIYEDPDHPGWYLLYDLQTGAYVHVLYMGM